jgi:hypothetical protein
MASVVRIGSSGSIGSGEDSLGSAPAFNPIGVATAGCVRTRRGIAAAAPLREATTSALRRRAVPGDPGELPRGCDVDAFVMARMGPCHGHTQFGGGGTIAASRRVAWGCGAHFSSAPSRCACDRVGVPEPFRAGAALGRPRGLRRAVGGAMVSWRADSIGSDHSQAGDVARAPRSGRFASIRPG